MRHKVAGFKLKRPVDSRQSLLRNLTTSVILEERVITTVPKAKAVRPLVERMITLAKTDTLHTRRQAAAFLRTPASVKKLFDTSRHALRTAQRRLYAHHAAGAAQGRRRGAGDYRAGGVGTGEARGRPRQAAGRAAESAARRPRAGRRGRRRSIKRRDNRFPAAWGSFAMFPLFPRQGLTWKTKLHIICV